MRTRTGCSGPAVIPKGDAMTEKLTAKLSDGSVWEVDIQGGDPKGYMNVNLHPIKREPREWWCVKDTEWPNMYCFFGSLSEAQEHHIANKLYRSKPFLVREVLE